MKRAITKENPFFSVKREKLFRKNGIYTGYDSLYRRDNMTQLAVVSRDYQLVRHNDAVHFIRSTLKQDRTGIEWGKDVLRAEAPGLQIQSHKWWGEPIQLWMAVRKRMSSFQRSRLPIVMIGQLHSV